MYPQPPTHDSQMPQVIFNHIPKEDACDVVMPPVEGLMPGHILRIQELAAEIHPETHELIKRLTGEERFKMVGTVAMKPASSEDAKRFGLGGFLDVHLLSGAEEVEYRAVRERALSFLANVLLLRDKLVAATTLTPTAEEKYVQTIEAERARESWRILWRDKPRDAKIEFTLPEPTVVLNKQGQPRKKRVTTFVANFAGPVSDGKLLASDGERRVIVDIATLRIGIPGEGPFNPQAVLERSATIE